MKTPLIIALLLLATPSATAQGTVLFQNYPNMDLVRFPDGRPIPAGDGWMAELLAGASSDYLVAVGTTTFRLPGVFGLGDPPLVLLDLPTGSHPYFQVRFWETRDGTLTSWDQVVQAGAMWGLVALFQISDGLGSADGDPPAPPLRGFLTWDRGGWIYVDRVEDDVVINWGRHSVLLGIRHYELAEAVDLAGPWTVISDAQIPHLAPAVGAGHRFYRTVPVYYEWDNQPLQPTRSISEGFHDQ
jgi:hypothetical protein